MYKHKRVPKGQKVQYLKCVRIPHETGFPSRKIKGTKLKKGALTWVDDTQIFTPIYNTIIAIQLWREFNPLSK